MGRLFTKLGLKDIALHIFQLLPYKLQFYNTILNQNPNPKNITTPNPEPDPKFQPKQKFIKKTYQISCSLDRIQAEQQVKDINEYEKNFFQEK